MWGGGTDDSWLPSELNTVRDKGLGIVAKDHILALDHKMAMLSEETQTSVILQHPILNDIILLSSSQEADVHTRCFSAHKKQNKSRMGLSHFWKVIGRPNVHLRKQQCKFAYYGTLSIHQLQ